MIILSRLLKPSILSCLIFLLIGLAGGPCVVSVQADKAFLIEDRGNELDIACVDSGIELFRIIVNKNGGIKDIVISYIVYATTACWLAAPSNQLIGSNATAEPMIQDMGDYLSLIFHSEFIDHALSVATNMTVSKHGLIVVHSTLKADADAPLVQRVAWGIWGFPANLFVGQKAYAQVEQRELQEIALLPEYAIGSNIGSLMMSYSTPVYWVDFSRPLEGITFINIVPSLTLGGEVVDGRPFGETTFNVYFSYCPWGQCTVAKGDLNEVKVALYLHGPGGYQSGLDLASLLIDLGKTESGVKKGLKTFTDEGSKSLASQALGLVESATLKILTGDTINARSEITQASDMLKRAEETEGTAAIIRDVLMIAIPVVVATVLIIFIKKRRRKP